MRALKEKWLTKRELHLIMEKSQGLENHVMMHSPFPVGTKIGKLVNNRSGKDLVATAVSE